MIECLSGGMIAQEILAWQLTYHVRTKQAGTVLRQQRVCSEFGGFRGGFGCKDNATVPQDPFPKLRGCVRHIWPMFLKFCFVLVKKRKRLLCTF